MHLKAAALLFIFLASGMGHASPLKYKLSEGWQKPRRIEMLEIRSAIEPKGFFALERKNFGKLPWIAVDQIFASPNLHQVIFLKMGMEPTDKKLLNTTIKGKAGTLFHSTSRDGNPYALLFMNFSDREVGDVLATLPLASKSEARIWPAFLPLAHAETISQSPGETPGAGGSSHALAAGATTCLLTAGAGAAQAAKETWDAAKQLVTDPWAFWDSIKNKFAEFKEVLANANVEIDQLVNALYGIDGETALALACNLAGQAAFASLLTAGGVGAAKGLSLLVKLLLQMKKSRALLESIARLRASGKLSSRDLGAVVNGVMSCAI